MQDFLSRLIFRLVNAATGSVLLAMFAAATLAPPARAHGEAQWIMDNPRYLDRWAAHCCGPTDCHREKAVNFREDLYGVYFRTGAGVELKMPTAHRGMGLYVSIDQDWWVCIRDGKLRCVFRPAKGS